MKKLIFVSTLVAMLLVGCGPKATPTMSPADVQGTAMAAASTMVAMTQAAIPTATPLPPTDTPMPTAAVTDTPFVLPTSDLSQIPTLAPTIAPQTSNGGQDNCLHPLNMAEAGPKHDTLVQNQSGGTINLSLNLYTPNAFGQCGAISYGNMGKNATVMAHLPAGYWYAYAWATLKGGKQVAVSGSFFVQPAQFDKLELCVRSDSIVYKPQC